MGFLSSKKVVCFIDDDEAEINRFESAFKNDYICIGAQSFSDCCEKLKKQNLKPSLFVLDLFFSADGMENTKEQLFEMNNKYAQLQEDTEKFKMYLAEIKQGKDGGIHMLKLCQDNFNAPVIMLTRKGTLEDAVECIDKGAKAVYKKPMPREWPLDIDEQKKAMDKAMLESRILFVDKFNYFIKENTFVKRYKSVISFVLGVIIGYFIENFLGILLKYVLNIV